jgi:hypothetical protein
MNKYLVSAQKVAKPGDTVVIKEVHYMSKIKITSQETIDTLEIAHAASLAGLNAGVPSRAVLPSDIILAKHADFSESFVTLPDYTYTDDGHKCITFARKKFDHASFYKQNLRHYEFVQGSFQEANFEKADLTGADLRYANLTGADLGEANLIGANLSYANLTGANLFLANLRGADLTGAILTGAHLDEARLDGVVRLRYPMACPSEGSFIGWKKAFDNAPNSIEDVLVKLEIPEDAKRSSATTYKCRANKAKVLDIVSIVGDVHYESACSFHDFSFIYHIGETVEVPEFDENRFNECSTGIHFFIDREEAIRYEL